MFTFFPPSFPPRRLKQSESGQSVVTDQSETVKPFHCSDDGADSRSSHTTRALMLSNVSPFYTYGEDGSNRRDNITDWALEPLPRPLRRRHDLQVGCFPLRLRPAPPPRSTKNATKPTSIAICPVSPSRPISVRSQRRARSWRRSTSATKSSRNTSLERTKRRTCRSTGASRRCGCPRTKTQLRYNNFLTLDGIPEAAFGYRLGNRSALEWIINQYRVKTDQAQRDCERSEPGG